MGDRVGKRLDPRTLAAEDAWNAPVNQPMALWGSAFPPAGTIWKT